MLIDELLINRLKSRVNARKPKLYRVWVVKLIEWERNAGMLVL